MEKFRKFRSFNFKKFKISILENKKILYIKNSAILISENLHNLNLENSENVKYRKLRNYENTCISLWFTLELQDLLFYLTFYLKEFINLFDSILYKKLFCLKSISLRRPCIRDQS